MTIKLIITRQQFENGGFNIKAKPGLTTHPVYLFLKERPNRAFHAKAIKQSVKLSESRCREVLAELAKKGLAEHNSPYYIIKLKNKRKAKKKR